MPQRPGYLARTEPLNKAGAIASPASGTDVFDAEPETPSVPLLNPACVPPPLITSNVARITVSNTETLIASLRVPSNEYDRFDIQWWTDYPWLVERQLIQVYFRTGGGAQEVNEVLPTVYPARYCRRFTKGTNIQVFARVNAGFTGALTGALGTPIYVGVSAQLGWERAQFSALAVGFGTGAQRQPEGTKRATVLVAPGAPLFNPFGAPSLVATNLRVYWPLPTPGAPAPGAIAVTTSAEGGGPQAVTYIDQALGVNLNNYIDLEVADVRELWLGNPPPATPLVLPASIVVEWDQWRIR